MCMIYEHADIEHLKRKAAASSEVIADENGLELIRCVDGVFRTAEQKAEHEAELWNHLRLTSQR